MSIVLRDRNGREATVGDQIRVQHCVGRYGQVAVVAGELLQIHMPHGVTLRLDHQVRTVGRDGGVRYVAAGDPFAVVDPEPSQSATARRTPLRTRRASPPGSLRGPERSAFDRPS